MLKLFFISLILLIISCTKEKQKDYDTQVTTFAFNSNRTGSFVSSIADKDFSKMNVHYPAWGANATKHMPLYIKLENQGKHLVYTNFENELVAVNLANDKILWKVNMQGIAASTPVYSKQKKIFYILTMNGTEHLSGYNFIAINSAGKIVDTHSINLLDIYKKNNEKITSTMLQAIYFKTALGINELNNEHYIYTASSHGKNPYAIKESLRSYYGEHRGATGSLIGLYINNRTGEFLNKPALTFFPSKISKKETRSGYNTGIYLAGGATALLKDNTLLLATGNGPSYPHLQNFGCSLIKIGRQNIST